MANLLVLLEIHEGTVLPVSLEALGQARRVATTLGATVYALVPLPEAPAYGEDDIIALCARYGADKVVLLTDEYLVAEAEMRFGTHGRAILAACQQLPPTILLCGATRGARDVAPRLAARLGAAYLAEGWISAEGDRLLLCDGEGRSLPGLETASDEGKAETLEHTVVLTVPPGRYAISQGEDEAEMVIVAAPPGRRDFAQVAFHPETAIEVRGPEPAQSVFLRALCEEPVPCVTGVAPSLVVSLSAPMTRVDGAVRVAIGGQAAGDAQAHYAWTASEEDVCRLLEECAADQGTGT